MLQVWWTSFLLLLTFSASTGPQHSRNLVHQLVLEVFCMLFLVSVYYSRPRNKKITDVKKSKKRPWMRNSMTEAVLEHSGSLSPSSPHKWGKKLSDLWICWSLSMPIPLMLARWANGNDGVPWNIGIFIKVPSQMLQLNFNSHLLQESENGSREPELN